MPQFDINGASKVTALAEKIIPEIETNWGCIIALDSELLCEAEWRARITLEHVGMVEPNEVKQAGHYAFWIRKLKPLRIVNLESLADEVRQLSKIKMVDGDINRVQDIVTPILARRLFINETFALLAAIGIAGEGGHYVEMSAKPFHDLVVSLRYHSFSPSAISALLMAYVR